MASPTNSSVSILGLPASVPMAHLEVLLTTLTATPNCSVPTQPTALSSSPKEGHINHFFDKFPPPPYTAHLVVGVVMTIVGIVAVVGNLFIIYIFLRFRSLRTPGNVFVPNLALADGMLALTGFPFYAISSFKGRWVFGPYVCSLYGMCGAAFGLMSINTLAAIAFERYLVIVKCYPVGRKSSKRHVGVLLLIVWLNSFSWAVAPVLGWNRYSLEGFGTTCSFDYTTRTTRYQSLVMTMFIVGFIVPLSLIMYCYIYIIAFVRDSERHLADTSEMMEARLWKGARKMCRRTELRIARTVILTVIFFCVSWLPYSAVALIGQFGDLTLVTPVTSAIPGIMAKMSTMYNPVIYSFSHPRIKQKVWLLLRAYFPDVGSTFVGQTQSNVNKASNMIQGTGRQGSLSALPGCRGRGGVGHESSGASRGMKSTPINKVSNSLGMRSRSPARPPKDQSQLSPVAASSRSSSPTPTLSKKSQSHSGSGEIVYFSKCRRSNNFFPSHGTNKSLTSSRCDSKSSSSSDTSRSFHTCQSEESSTSSSGARHQYPVDSKKRGYTRVRKQTQPLESRSTFMGRTMTASCGRAPTHEVDEV